MKIILFILMILIIAGLILVNNHNLHLVDKKELNNFSKLYFNWADQVYSNFFSITGHFAKLDWLPK